MTNYYVITPNDTILKFSKLDEALECYAEFFTGDSDGPILTQEIDVVLTALGARFEDGLEAVAIPKRKSNVDSL